MTLDELRAELAKLQDVPGDAVVVLAASPEGLHYSPATTVTEGLYEGDANSGVMYLTEGLRQHLDDPSEFEPAPGGARPAVFLYPAG